MLNREYKNEPMSDAMIGRVVERLRALADESRVRLILRLKEGPATVGELSAAIGVAQPSTSKHLAILKHVGLVESARNGAAVTYRIRDQTIFDLCHIVCAGVTQFAREQHEALGIG
jgi:DNA-binding transcriptional ArsR family regulator